MACSLKTCSLEQGTITVNADCQPHRLSIDSRDKPLDTLMKENISLELSYISEIKSVIVMAGNMASCCGHDAGKGAKSTTSGFTSSQKEGLFHTGWSLSTRRPQSLPTQ